MSFPDRLVIPEDVLEIARTLEAAGHAAWCVGGAVRDNLLGVASTDFDVATSATPDQVLALFRHTVAVGERFGTIAVRTRRRHHEVTSFRKDVATDGRHAVVQFGVSLDEDLARRDFTINAIAYHPLRHEWRDPFDGRSDLDRRIVRAVGAPGERFREDFLRILRALRFAARFEFQIQGATWDAAREAAPGLVQLSAERVREEWFKGLQSAHSISRLVDLWWSVGAAAVWIPELVRPGPVGVSHAGPEPGSIGEPLGERQTWLPGLSDPRMPRDPALLTILLTVNPVVVLQRLKASNVEIARAAAVLAGAAEPEALTPVAVRRWMAAVGEAAQDFTTLWTLRHGAAPPWEPAMRGIRERGEPLTRKALAISGNELREVGVPPGPAMGNMLEQLLAQVVDDPSLNTREALLERARSLL